VARGYAKASDSLSLKVDLSLESVRVSDEDTPATYATHCCCWFGLAGLMTSLLPSHGPFQDHERRKY
jgi:hypothetical protein